MAKQQKRRPNPKSRKASKKPRLHAHEVTGVILLILSIFLILCLISFDPRDPSWASSDTASGRGVHNYLGRVGASCAEALLQLLGFAAFILPGALLYLGVRCFFPEEGRRVSRGLGSTFLLLVIVAALLHTLLHDVIWRTAPVQAGGLFGQLTAGLLIRYFNHVGSLFILISALFLFLVLSTRVSLAGIFQGIGHLFDFLFKEIRLRITHYQKERSRERMRQRVVEKYTEKKPTSHREKGRLEASARKSEPADKASPQPTTPSKQKKERKPAVPITISAPPIEEKLLFPEVAEKGSYGFPPLNLLDHGKESEQIDKEELFHKKQIIEDKFLQFRVEGEVREYHPGPIITTYEYYPHPHIKVSQVVNLSEDLSLALGAESVRMQRIPGKSSIGLEIPNNKREIIKLRDVIQTEKFLKSPSKLTIALGKTINGEPYITDLSVMPHLLIAGATGTGKSVALNTIIASILYKATPQEVKLILIDPKRIEFSLYDGIPHLLCPVVKDSRKAEAILLDAIKKMEGRYQTLGWLKVRNIEQFNQQIKRIREEKGSSLTPEENEKYAYLPYIVIIIDELAELMMVGAKEVEYCIARLAQLARAVGIHLVMATQRPSTDVITGTIKNNFASRIAFRVPSKIDSRVIIDQTGADKLLGKGDMLFMPPNFPRVLRLHSSFISLPEVTRLLKFVKEQGKPEYDESIVEVLKSPAGHIEEKTNERDPLFEKAVELILMTGQASASYLQRKMKLGYARASRIIDQMEAEGVVGPSEGSKPREILMDPDTYRKKLES